MKVTVQMLLEMELFDLAEYRIATVLAAAEEGSIYTWKTVGRTNWLEYGVHPVDAVGLVVLPKGLPDWIDMMDDDPDEDE